MLCYTIIFSVLLMNIQAQCEIPAVGNNLILQNKSDQQTFPDGATVKFKCGTGYVPVRASASRSINCTGTQWSELQLQCKRKSCGNPGEIHNGNYLFPDGILYGATIAAQCNKGYQLVGQPRRNCRERGWDGRAPVCEVVKCLKAPSVIDGVFEPAKDLYDYGEGLRYSCKRGLNLIGPSIITCSSDGTFQPATPLCLFITCDGPDIQNAVQIEGKSPPYHYNHFVRYQCDKGYKMEGSDFLTCKEDGWNPPPPQCTIVTCSPPPNITNGQFNPLLQSYEYKQTVRYSCNQGFTLHGRKILLCTEDGTFQSPPLCKEIFCGPPTIQNAVILGSSPPYRFNVSVQIRCNEGYKRVGSDHLTCRKSGWHPRLPHCTELTCSTLRINNALVVGEKALSYKYNSSIRYQCNEGYRMEGSELLTCEESGWTPPPPECNKVTCDELQIKHGFIVGGKSTSYGYNSSVQVQCNSGYVIDGCDFLTCEEDGWNPTPPQCCLDVKSISHLNTQVSMFSTVPPAEEPSPESIN